MLESYKIYQTNETRISAKAWFDLVSNTENDEIVVSRYVFIESVGGLVSMIPNHIKFLELFYKNHTEACTHKTFKSLCIWMSNHPELKLNKA